MKRKSSLPGSFLLCFALIPLISQGQTIEKTTLGARAQVKGIHTEIRFYSPSIVRIIKYPVGKPSRKESLSVIAIPGETPFQMKNTGRELILTSEEMIVTLNTQSGNLQFATKQKNPLLKEQADGARFTPFLDAGESTYSVEQAFRLDQEEAIYGLGQQQKGRMIQRNINLSMIQGNTDDYIPFFLSVKGYGVFWDNYSPTQFNDDQETTSFRSEVGDCIDYYFINGNNADGVIAGMRSLTGQVPMFPLWTFGFWQSKERYKSQDELVNVVKKYRDIGVPLDGIIQDWQYWGNNYLWNSMEFLNVEFPDPQKMVQDIHGLNAHLAISIWNSFGPQTKQYRELEKIGALMDFSTWPQSGSEKWPPIRDYPSGVKVYDPYNPFARDIYWKYLSYLHSLGLDAWWMDSSEPDHLDFKPADLDNKTYLGSFRKVRNAFPLMTVGGVATHQRKIDSSKRIFILTRSAFAGQQRYGANTWSGDVTASWEALRNQISAGLNFSLTAIPYWNSDIGGFFLTKFKNPVTNPNYRELYLRWLQFGAFCPMMRSHGADAPREIYQFGARGDKIYDAIEKSIRLRYRLLPYIYASSWEVTRQQSTMMRALVMDFPFDKNALDIQDEYLFGRSILVAPVTEKMYVKPVSVQGKDTIYTPDYSAIHSKQVYLPAGSNWVDFWSGKNFSGGQKINRETPLDIIPLYVKGGSILPFGPDVQFAAEKPWDTLEIRIYPGADGRFNLYEDENDNYNYEKGHFTTIPFSWNEKKRELVIGDRSGHYNGMLEKRIFKIVLVNENKGTGDLPSLFPDKWVEYEGKKSVLRFEAR